MSSDNNMELSRRKILAGMGAVGAAGAGAGLGTSALFSDTESFVNNSITAGELDLKMDWEEHYSFPQIYEGTDPDASPAELTDPTTAPNDDPLDVQRSKPSDTSNYVGLPDPDDPVVWVNDNDGSSVGGNDGKTSLDYYFEQTIIEAFPDTDSTDPGNTYVGVESGEATVSTPCNTLADVPEPGLKTYNENPDPDNSATEDTDYFISDLARSANADTWDSENDEYKPLINLTDVKPGDYGEITFSAHLCGNPGHLWLQMPGGLEESEGGLTEPESDPAFGNDQTTGNDGELAENIKATLWYDNNCNNRIDGEPKDLVALAIIDNSGSASAIISQIRTAANELTNQLQSAQASSDVNIFAGVIAFDDKGDDNDVFLVEAIKDVSNITDFDDTKLPATSGNSPLQVALDVGREYLNDKTAALQQNSSVDLDADPNKQILLVSDGAVNLDTGGATADARLGDLRDATADFSNGTPSPGGTYTFTDSSSTTYGPYTSDYFDNDANNTGINLPDPDDNTEIPSSSAKAETALVARDVDGEPFLTPSATGYQGAGNKIDSPDQQGDPKEISGDETVDAVRTVIAYDTNGDLGQDNVEDTMQVYATNSNAVYNLVANSPTTVVNDLVGDLNVRSGENVIFDNGQSLLELAAKLDPQDGDGPYKLQGNQPDGCFAGGGSTHCFGLAWWVPEDVGNEIQSDSASFDLGFYTEQCRNNPTPDGP